MDSYSSSSNTDCPSPHSYSHSSTWLPNPYQQQLKSSKPPPAFRSALHSVRRPPITKKPIAPLPPTPPKIYKVDKIEFKEVVQKLTGAPQFQPTRLQEVAPPPLSLSPPHLQPNLIQDSAMTKPFFPEKSFDTTFGALSPLGFSLSPSSLAWCSAMLLSPGTLASFEPSNIVL